MSLSFLACLFDLVFCHQTLCHFQVPLALLSFASSRKTPFPLFSPSNLHPTFLKTLLVLFCFLPDKWWNMCWGQTFFLGTSLMACVHRCRQYSHRICVVDKTMPQYVSLSALTVFYIWHNTITKIYWRYTLRSWWSSRETDCFTVMHNITSVFHKNANKLTSKFLETKPYTEIVTYILVLVHPTQF